MDFECQSEKGGDPASGPPPSLPAGELLIVVDDDDDEGSRMIVYVCTVAKLIDGQWQ